MAHGPPTDATAQQAQTPDMVSRAGRPARSPVGGRSMPAPCQASNCDYFL